MTAYQANLEEMVGNAEYRAELLLGAVLTYLLTSANFPSELRPPRLDRGGEAQFGI